MFTRHDCIVDRSTNWGIVFRWSFQIFMTNQFSCMARCARPDTTYHLNIRIILHQSSIIRGDNNAFPNFHKTADRWTNNFFFFFGELLLTWTYQYYYPSQCLWTNIVGNIITRKKMIQLSIPNCISFSFLFYPIL